MSKTKEKTFQEKVHECAFMFEEINNDLKTTGIQNLSQDEFFCLKIKVHEAFCDFLALSRLINNDSERRFRTMYEGIAEKIIDRKLKEMQK